MKRKRRNEAAAWCWLEDSGREPAFDDLRVDYGLRTETGEREHTILIR
jgi:hypothetical protein